MYRMIAALSHLPASVQNPQLPNHPYQNKGAPFMSSNEVVERILANPKFQELVRKRSRISWTMFFIVVTLYYLLMGTVAFFPEALRTLISPESVVTIGWPLGAGVIVISWLLTGLYIRKANSELEPLNDAILKDLK
jgi:uncharacterized membrane protein (DUF485 family)